MLMFCTLLKPTKLNIKISIHSNTNFNKILLNIMFHTPMRRFQLELLYFYYLFKPKLAIVIK